MSQGKLEQIPIQEKWAYSDNFKRWLISNIETLNDTLNLELDIINKKIPLFNRSLDILARDMYSSKIVLIQNQVSVCENDFNYVDFYEFGEMITYASGVNASIIICIASEFTKEYRQVFEWLNKITDIETHFYLLQVKVYKINSRKSSIIFEPIVVSEDW